MTIGEGAQMITAIAACIGAISSLRNSSRLKKVEQATDGLTDRLVKSTDRAATAEGHAEGLAQGRDEANR